MATETLKTETPKPTPEVLTLPHSWEKGGTRATLLRVEPQLPGRSSPSPGYKRLGVVGKYQNLQNVAVTDRYMLDSGALLPVLELETTRGNRYKTLVGSGFLPPPNGLRPEEASGEMTATFEIRVDEEPVTLFGLVYMGTTASGFWEVAYVWRLR